MLSEFRTYAADHAEPLDDLTPLVEAVREARIVAVGESAHWIKQYQDLRLRLTKPLVERCGFDGYALESGFAEGRAVDAWVRGGPGELDDLASRGLTNRMGQTPEIRELLAWMRVTTAPLGFLGLDVPATPTVPGIVRGEDAELAELTGRYANRHPLLAHEAYAGLDRADRDRVTALLTDLLTRLETRGADRELRHQVRLAVLLDQGLRGNHAARDLGMAQTALTVPAPGSKIVIGAANSHIQRVPMPLPGMSVPTMGTHLRDAGYLSVAVTTVGGVTTSRRRDPAEPGGVAVVDVALPPARDDSVESALPEGGWILDLRPARGKMTGPSSTRVLDGWQEVDVLEAYDLVVCLDHVEPSERLDAGW
ncbi:erythromycin esterase family protein [Actinoplanes sp. NPDC051494]|uniref:erythromycin esterase family protein n=1 Tax=Actinoplanes sp. NPDC051494 TaxID=3363907 RepID=UPI0037911A4C